LSKNVETYNFINIVKICRNFFAHIFFEILPKFLTNQNF